MAYPLPRRPRTAIGYCQVKKAKSAGSGYGFQTQNVSKKCRSLSGSIHHPTSYENVETFNLGPGYRLSKSSGKLFVRINQEEFFNPPKQELPAKKLDPIRMESLIADLREQVTYLTTFLEEERLRHEGTKKRANLDLQDLEQRLRQEYAVEIEKIHKAHEEMLVEVGRQNNVKVAEVEAAAKKRYEELRSEYRLLQASFKNFRSHLQDEMNGQWNFKVDEIEWEKKREIDNAVDDCKRALEEKFSEERFEMRQDFKKTMNEMMREHKLEVETVTRKLTGDGMDIEELKRRSKQLDHSQQEVKDLKKQLREQNDLLRRTTVDLDDTRTKLSMLQNQFEDRVAAVDDHHRARIDGLLLEKSETKLKLAKSCSDLQDEKIKRETAETVMKESAIKAYKAKLRESEDRIASIQRTLPVDKQLASIDPDSTELETDDSRIHFEETPRVRSSDSLSNEIDLSDLIDRLVGPQRVAKQVLIDSLSDQDEFLSPAISELSRKRGRVATAPPIREPLRFSVPPIDRHSSVPGTSNPVDFQPPPVSSTTVPGSSETEEDETKPKRRGSPGIIY